MKLIHRFAYYFSGFSIGIILLLVILNGKNASCAYGPDARTLKSIRTAEKVYSPQVKTFLVQHQFDSTTVNFILETGDVDFEKSTIFRGDARKDSCNVYNIYGEYQERQIEFMVERCDSVVTIKKMGFKSE